MVTLLRTTSDHQDFRQLLGLLDADLRIRDGDEHTFYAQYNKVDAIQHVVVAYQDKVAVGCGAIKAYADDTMEIKRMFVKPAYRNQGIAIQIVDELESWARELDHTFCILETGKNNPEAIALYLKLEYTIIPNYGQYKDVENSVCMKKRIK